MRILIVTNFYPPYQLGGMGESCQQVVKELQARGHEVAVLTSMNGTRNTPVEDGDVYRWLYLEMDFEPWLQALKFFLNRKQREAKSLQRFQQLLDEQQPDVLFVWGMWNLPRSLAAFAEEQYPQRVVYRFAEYWPTLPSQYVFYWQATGRRWYSRLPKAILGLIARGILAFDERPVLKFERAICVSETTRDTLVDAGIPVEHARVIHTGIDAEPFLVEREGRTSRRAGEPLVLLYAGRFETYKGVETVIEAMRLLVQEREKPAVKLILAGSGTEDYNRKLQEIALAYGLEEFVDFVGRIPHDEMPQLMAQCDAVVMPSTWEEPFARVVLEGMSSGLAVISTPLGGSKEIIRDGENGLFFKPGDAGDLSSKLLMLVDHQDLVEKLARSGVQTVREGYTVEKMMDEIEAYLLETASIPLEVVNEQLPSPEAV